MKRNYKHGEIYASDLLAWVGIPKQANENLLIELTDLFSSYAEDNIKEVYQEIMFICELPNGQMRGKLPPLEKIKKILDNTRKEHMQTQVSYDDYVMVCPQCNSAYPLDQYRCLDGYLVVSNGKGQTMAVKCRDHDDERVGPRLKKEKLEPIPREYLKF